MARLTVLTQEIDAVLSVPYVPSLKALHDVVETLPRRSLQHWTMCKPCQIEPLAAVLLEGLGTWPYCVRLLARWAEIREVRDAILRRESAILDQLIQSAISSPSHGEARFFKYIHHACLALLSHRLPSTFALPARVQSFTVSVLDEVAQDSSPSAFRAVHSLLKGVQPILLDLVPGIVLEAFLRRCQTILRTKAQRNPINDMFVLAIFAQIRGGFPQNDSCLATGPSPTTPGSPQLRMILEKANDVFKGKQAFNSLTFVVLDSVLCVSANRNCSVDEAIETLRLAKEVLEAIPEEMRYDRKERFSSHIEKLLERVLRDDIEPQIQLAGLPLCQLLVPLPPPTILQASGKMALLESVATLDQQDQEALLSITLGDTNFSEPAILKPMVLDFVSNVIGVCPVLGKRMTQDDVLRFHYIRRSLRVFQTALKHSNSLGKAIASAVPIQSIPEWWECDFTLAQPSNRFHACYQSPVCVNSAEALVFDNTRDVSALVLEAAFTTINEPFVDPYRHKYATFINRLRLAHTIPTSTWLAERVNGHAEDAISTFQLKPALKERSMDKGVSHDWRTNIRDMMAQNAVNGTKDALKTFDSVCRDLEDRVKTAEAPLRAKEEEFARLSYQKDALVKQHKNDLGILKSEHRGQEAHFKNQRRLAEQECMNMKEERERLIMEHKSLLEETIQGRVAAEHTVSEVQKQKEQLTARYESDFEATLEKCRKAEQLASDLQDEKEKLIAESDAMLGNLRAEHRARTEQQEHQLQSQRHATAELKSEVDHAVGELQFSLSAALSKQDTLEREKDGLSTSLASCKIEKAELLSKVSSLAAQGETLTAQVAVLTSIELDLKARNAALGNELYERDAHSRDLADQVDSLTLEKQRLEQINAEKDKEADDMKNTIAQQTKEIKEARKLRKKMAGLIGGLQPSEKSDDRHVSVAGIQNGSRKSVSSRQKRRTLAAVAGNEPKRVSTSLECGAEDAKGAILVDGGKDIKTLHGEKENEICVTASFGDEGEDAFDDTEMVDDDAASILSL